MSLSVVACPYPEQQRRRYAASLSGRCTALSGRRGVTRWADRELGTDGTWRCPGVGVTGQGPQSGDGMEPYGGDDEESAAVLRTVGKVVKMWRERKGLTQAELGAAIGYSEEQVSSVERGRRAPKAQFLEAADQVLGAGGMIAGLKKDVEE